MAIKKVELYYFPECPFCQIVFNQVESLNLESKITLKNINTDSEAESYHINTTGRRTVPCLYIDGKPLFESSDIIEWLSKNHQSISPA